LYFVSCLHVLRELNNLTSLFFGPRRCLEPCKIKVKVTLEQTMKA